MRVIPYLLMALVLLGCAQQTEVPISVPSRQEMVTPTTTALDTATQGTDLEFVINQNPPGTGDVPGVGADKPIKTLDQIIAETVQPPDGANMSGALARYRWGDIHFTITTGGTIPTVSGVATGTATGSQVPTVSPTVSPVQDVKPEIGISAALGIAPGGMIDQTLSALGGKGTLTPTTTVTQDQRIAELRALAETLRSNPQMLTDFLSFLGLGPPPETQPGN